MHLERYASDPTCCGIVLIYDKMPKNLVWRLDKFPEDIVFGAPSYMQWGYCYQLPILCCGENKDSKVHSYNVSLF
jgi:hypothetical protein